MSLLLSAGGEDGLCLPGKSRPELVSASSSGQRTTLEKPADHDLGELRTDEPSRARGAPLRSPDVPLAPGLPTGLRAYPRFLPGLVPEDPGISSPWPSARTQYTPGPHLASGGLGRPAGELVKPGQKDLGLEVTL